MAITFDASTNRIILDSFAVTATEIYSRWVDWAALSDNLKYGMVIRQVGSDDLGSGLNIPPYYFLQGAWRVRPMEASGLTVITGNLFVEGGGNPAVQTLGSFNSQVQYTVPVQAQGFDSGGGGGGSAPTVVQIRQEMDANSSKLAAILADTNELQLDDTPAQLAGVLVALDYVRKIVANKAVTDGSLTTIYDDDKIAPLLQFNHPDAGTRDPV